VCIATNHPYTKPNPNHNHTTKQYAITSIQLNVVTCLDVYTYAEKFTQNSVVAPFLQLSVLIVPQPIIIRHQRLKHMSTQFLSIGASLSAVHVVKQRRNERRHNRLASTFHPFSVIVSVPFVFPLSNELYFVPPHFSAPPSPRLQCVLLKKLT